MRLQIPDTVVSAIERHLSAKVSDYFPASGGCINNGGKVVVGGKDFFVKWNDRSRYPGMFQAEAKGLHILGASETLRIPEVIHVGEEGSFQYLLLEYIDDGRRSPDFWESFGRGLAKMHKHSAPRFGLDHNNFIGSLPQDNRESGSWIEFFIERRLRSQLAIALQNNGLNKSAASDFDKLFAKLNSLLPDERPSLLHGDLWGGNLMIADNGEACLIDPAVYYGHREVDLAMTQLFGGFDSVFFESYNEEFPLLPGYRERLDLYNLYPLLVHVNLFGGGYAAQVMSVLRRFL
jgi:protein-ribulosamine 3-kinase